MAKISLRVYNREIEGLIEGGQLNEAVAHCQHILKTFSMHIETYRLIGKAFLEGRQFTDATDIFQRVLNAVPDDFVAHVGMSIIRDDEGKLDEAIWHMERAFEVQPSNPAIQGELRRLYGRRDGVEPPKIRLSRDALANMYAQGELFNQAIAEIRAVLTDDPNRPDLQVMLARAYLRVGQKVEAAEMAAQLLKKYPYCLDALRILVEVLPGTARAENTQVYRQRLRLLDPYSSFVTGSVFASDQVADAAVNLEKLEYQPGKQVTPSQPTWAASLGVKLSEDKRSDSQPAWLAGGQAESPAVPASPVSGPEAGPAQEGEAIPDFLRTAGWNESSNDQSPEGGMGLGEESPAEGIAKGEMPDWLKSQVPPELSGAEKPADEPAPVEGGDFPDWLTSLGAAAGAASSVGEAESENPAEEKPTEPVSFAPPPATEVEPAPEVPIDLPPESGFASSAPAEMGDAQRADIEDGTVAPAEMGDAQRVGIEDDTVAALKGLAAKQGAEPEEFLANPEERFEELPLTDAQPPASEPQPAESGEPPILEKPGPVPVETKPLPDLRSAFHITEESVPEETPPPASPEAGTAKPLGIEDDTMAWLEGLAAKQGAKAEELLSKPEERSEVMPDWLQKTAQEPVPAPASQTGLEAEIPNAPPEMAAEEPVILPEALAASPEDVPLEAALEEQPPASAEEDITITTWLKNLNETGGLEELPAAPPAPEPSPSAEEEIPDWLKDLESKPIQPAPAAEEQPAGAASDLPDWLRQPAAPVPEGLAPRPAQAEDELPDWTMDDVKPEEQAVPTTPEEWLPAEKLEISPEPQAESLPITEEPGEIAVPPFSQLGVPKGTGILSPVPEQDKDAALLMAAQGLLESNRLDESMKEYAKLIRKGRLLDETIHDLREALYRFPVDIIVWQTLGDAYMRANRLQDALDAYTKAEELLR